VDASDPHAELDLARRAHRGDAAAFDQLVVRFQRPVYRLCRRMLRSPHAEDFAQETFVRAFVHFDRFDPARPLLPWLLAIARRLCLDRLRRERLMIQVDDPPVAVDPAPSPERQAELKEGISRLQRALAELDEGPREAIVLFHVEEMSYRDIAAALEVPIGTVMTWLHRSRAQHRRAAEDVTAAFTTPERPSAKDRA
jgi:RNA polymerase sigma-70 factor (ECF subfamily)